MNDECPFDGEIPTNPPTARPAPTSQLFQSDLERIANTPMESLGFKDFKNLKCGRDQFSKMKPDDLKAAIDWVDVSKLIFEFRDDLPAVAPCIRWMLRGLPMDKAIRKVRVDEEVSANARSKKWR